MKNKKIKQIRAASKKSKLSLLIVFIFAFAGIGGLIVLKSRAAPGLCSTTGVIGSATYNVTAPETAQYRLWVRMQVPDTTNTGNINGVRVELAGSSQQCFTVTTANANAVNSWQWVNSDATAASTPHITSQITSGSYTAKILGLKAGVKVDKVLLLKSDNTCIPSNDMSNGQPGDNCTTAAPVVSLSANPSAVTTGGSTVLTWSVTDATSCTAGGSGTGWSGSKTASATNQTQTLNNRTATQTYSLTCTGPGGQGSREITVTVNPPPAPTVNLTVNPTSVLTGNPVTLTWTVANATTCTASGGWSGSKTATTGTHNQSSGNLTSNQVFDLSCTGPGGTTSAPQVAVTVTAAPPPTDTTPPSVTMALDGVTLNQGGAQPTLVRNLKELSWRPLASDTSGVSTFVLTVNGQSISLTNNAYIFGGLNTGRNGDYALRAVATDTRNNTTTSNATIRLRHPDINRNGRVDLGDLTGMMLNYGQQSTVYDIGGNINGTIDLADLTYLMLRYNSTE